VPDVHLLGDVGMGIVHHHGPGRVRPLRAEALVAQGVLELVGDPLVAEADVDEPRAGDLQGRRQVRQVGLGQDLLGQGAGVGAEPLGCGHDAVGLVVAETAAGGGDDHGRQVGSGHGAERRRETPVEMPAQVHEGEVADFRPRPADLAFFFRPDLRLAEEMLMTPSGAI